MCFGLWTDLISLLILFLLLFLRKRLRFRRFKSDRGKILQDCSLCNYVSIDGFSIWRHTFRLAVMTSFHAEKCCHLGSGHAASARYYWKSPFSITPLSFDAPLHWSLQILVHTLDARKQSRQVAFCGWFYRYVFIQIEVMGARPSVSASITGIRGNNFFS